MAKRQLSSKKCSIEECNNPISARGWCHKHYMRWYKHGSPHTVLKQEGENNSNYKHGAYIIPSYCKCSAIKDYRSKRCSTCANLSFPTSSKIAKYDTTPSKIKEVIERATNYIDAALALGMPKRTLMKLVMELNLQTSTSHFRNGSRKGKAPIEELLTKDSPATQGVIKSRVLQEGILEYKCSACGLGPEWNKLPLTLELHHINGNGRDNRIENITIMCPNCHRQAVNHRKRHIKK